MEFDSYDISEDIDNDIIWLNERPPPPPLRFNDPITYPIAGRSYGRNTAPAFNQYGPYQGPRWQSFWGKGYGAAGPTNQLGFTNKNDTGRGFLLHCGVPKPAVYRLPKALVSLMGPEYCGVCGLELDNSLGARFHYVSRNHVKNQKKWLTQQAKNGSMRPKELPMRARELYCELCDVHITSRAHADSHYAGKTHRAIVDGRKVPKNPFLLQETMQKRVKQLIRREMKSLPIIDSSAVIATPKTDPVPIPPELYCDICKTSVTNTDQMAMHLNGKRHLSKEKQHIFKMMAGGTTSPKPAEPDAIVIENPAEPEATAKENPAEPEATAKDADAQSPSGWEKWDTNEHKDETDWVDGSDAWADDPQ